ncbi:cytochrome P450 [Nostocoides vanveenii]|uniref:Cytochrome P450 n=1 Tax=Nostocoides vanveenii TaxID=330835 RepID=A0ABN2KY84_9MICO
MTVDVANRSARVAAEVSDDLFGDVVLADREHYFADWRERAAVVHLRQNDIWAVTRYDALKEVVEDPSRFSSAKATFNDLMNASLRGTALASDPPEHARHRAVLAKYLSPRVMRARRDDMTGCADELVAAAVAKGTFDAVRLAQDFHQRVIGDLIGMRREIQARVVPWGDSALNVFGPFNKRTGQHFPVAGDLARWAKQVTPAQLTEGSLGREVFAAAERGEVPPDACNALIHQMVAAGIDTAIASLGNVLAHLGDNPDQYAILRAEPGLIGSAFTESLRYESPIHAMGRLVVADTEIDGVPVPGGAQLALLFGAANRDPRHYPDPDRFDIRRNPIDQVSFGHGVHTCAGMHLVRQEAEVLIAAWLRHVPAFLLGHRTRKLSNMVSSWATLAITVG